MKQIFARLFGGSRRATVEFTPDGYVVLRYIKRGSMQTECFDSVSRCVNFIRANHINVAAQTR